VVTRVNDQDVCEFEDCYILWMDALLLESPHECSLSQERLYQVLHLANLSTDQCSWQEMVSGVKDRSGIINFILTRSNNGVSIGISLFLSLLFCFLLLCTDSIF